MKPTKSILDKSFVYIPPVATNVEQTWRRFGWRPVGEPPPPEAPKLLSFTLPPKRINRG